MLKESQRLQYVVTEVQGPSIKAEFTDCKASVQLPMEKVLLLFFLLSFFSCTSVWSLIGCEMQRLFAVNNACKLLNDCKCDQ